MEIVPENAAFQVLIPEAEALRLPLPATTAPGPGATSVNEANARRNAWRSRVVEPGTYRHPHQLLVMITSARLTVTAFRLYLTLMHVSQIRMMQAGAVPQSDQLFEAPLSALLLASGESVDDRTNAKRYLRAMRTMSVDWESTAPGDGPKWVGFSMLSELSIDVRKGENWVSWSFPPTVMSLLKDPELWANIDLKVVAKLSTYASVALYLIVARYRLNPGGLTSRKPASWWQDALSTRAVAGESRPWRKFKSERVKGAVDEICRVTDLDVELVETKATEGENEVQFIVRRKRGMRQEAAPNPAPVDARLVQQAESLGLRESKLDALIREFGDALVDRAISALEARVNNKTLRPVENAYSYARALLRNAEDESELAVPALPAPTSQPSAPAPPMSAVLAGGAGAISRAGEGGREEWLTARMEALRAEVAAVSPGDRRRWIDKAVQEIKSKGLFNAVISRRAADGDALHGMLGTYVVRQYALATYGPGWMLPPEQRPEAA